MEPANIEALNLIIMCTLSSYLLLTTTSAWITIMPFIGTSWRSSLKLTKTQITPYASVVLTLLAVTHGQTLKCYRQDAQEEVQSPTPPQLVVGNRKHHRDFWCMVRTMDD